jgi:ribosomal protein L3 glutamine methyltransferase
MSGLGLTDGRVRTVAEVVHALAQQFDAAALSFGHGTTSAHDEAAWLVLWSLGLPLDADDEAFTRPVTVDEAAAVAALAQRRIGERLPLAYLTGEAWLQGLPFFVDRRSIVPRSLIAEALAEASIDPWLHAGTRQVLDLCTGNGSLAVLAALAWPEVQVLATDVSAEALAVAAHNVQRHKLGHRITLAQGDGWLAAPGRFDLVLSNPPYVNAASMATLPPEYRAEPSLALAGGLDGMDFIRPLLAGAAEHLNEHGVLVLEVGHERAHFEAAFVHLHPVWLATASSDDQVLLLTREALRARP